MENRKVALVTGGGGGIGGAICGALAEAGHRVLVADIDLEAAELVAERIDGESIELDVTDPDSVELEIEHVRADFGAVEILVNCVGYDDFKPFLETDEAFTEKILEINLAGPIRVTRRVLGPMVEAGWGRIISIASDAGRVGSSLEAIYSGAKGGLIAFSKTIAREVARFGVTSNSVCPGPTETRLLERAMKSSGSADRVGQALKRAIPMGRIGRPGDIAPAVVFLASDGAGYITGQTLSVSGGLTMSG